MVTVFFLFYYKSSNQKMIFNFMATILSKYFTSTFLALFMAILLVSFFFIKIFFG